MTATVRIDATNLVKALDNVVANLPKKLRQVSSKTATYGKSQIGKMIVNEAGLNVKQSEAKKDIKISKGATSATLVLKKTARLSLKRFKPKQYGKRKSGKNKGAGGVSYKLKKGQSATRIAGAFILPTKGSHVYKRIGKSRLPIAKLHGPSPWGVMRANNRLVVLRKRIRERLQKELVEAIRYNTLKQSGAI